MREPLYLPSGLFSRSVGYPKACTNSPSVGRVNALYWLPVTSAIVPPGSASQREEVAVLLAVNPPSGLVPLR